MLKAYLDRIPSGVAQTGEEKDLPARYSKLIKENKDVEKIEVGKSVVLRMRGRRPTDQTCLWTDGRKRLVSIETKGIPAVPAEIAEAYLAVVPSRVADMEAPGNSQPAGK